jgi:TRAP-type C4-dicarboxylate transport system permease small subunit
MSAPAHAVAAPSPPGAPGAPARALAALDRAVSYAVIAIMAAMVVVVSLQVLLRYAFNTSIDWADDVGRLLFVWSIFLTIPLGIREGIHIGIELVVKLLPEPVRHALVRLIGLLSIGMMAIICYQAVLVTLDQWDEMLPTLEVTVAVFMIPVAIGAGHSVLHLLRLVLTGTGLHSKEAIE